MSALVLLATHGGVCQVLEVLDEAGNPIPAAVIQNNVGEVRMTDLDGKLRLDSLIREGDTLSIRSLGYGLETLAMPDRAMRTSVSLSPEAVNLSEVVVVSVHPSREMGAAATVNRITAEEVTRTAPANAATLLWRSGQVHIQQSQQGGGSPVLRGFEANRILLVVDGVRLNNAIYRSGHLHNAMTIDPFILASTDVLHGAGSVQFGSDALGGVIHYRTRSPRWDEGATARGLAHYSGASRSPSFHADAEVTRGRLSVLTSVTHRQYGDLRMGAWRAHGDADWGRIPWTIETRYSGTAIVDSAGVNPDPNVQPGTGYHQTDLLQKVRYGRRDRHVEVNLQHSTGSAVPRFDRLNDVAADGGPKWAEWDYGPQERTLVSARFHGGVRGLGAVSLTTAWQRIVESRLTARFGAQQREIQLESVDVASMAFDVDRTWGRWRSSFGAFLSGDKVVSEAWKERRADGLRLEEPMLTRYPNGGAGTGTAALYAAANRQWNRWSILAATRYTRGWLSARFTPQAGLALPFDSVAYNRGAWTASTTLRWSPIPRAGLHTVLSTAFRNPNVDDIGKVRAKDGFAVLPSEGTLPERLYSAEFGGYWRSPNGKWSSRVAGFATALRDAIVPVDTTLITADGTAFNTIVVEGDTNIVQVNANVGRAVISGSHWQLAYRAGSGWNFRANVNFTRGIDAAGAAPLSHIPPAYGRLSARRNGEWLAVEAHMQWSTQKPAAEYGPGSTDNLAEALPEGNPGWWILGADVEARLTARTTLSFGVHNALDRHYKVFSSGISAPGRDMRCGIRWMPTG